MKQSSNSTVTPRSLALACLTSCLLAPAASANCLLLHDGSHPSHWVWHVSTVTDFTNMESTDSYFSGEYGDEDWVATHDLDGTLYGMTLTGSPPVLGNKFSGYFTYRKGELDGDFSTRGVGPFPDGPYPGEVSFDREEYELGVDVLILNAVYARVAYNHYQMDGDWTYPDDADEPQKYQYDSFEVGVGFRQDYESCYDPRLTFGVDAYLALVFFEYEHTEVDGGATADTDGTGFKGRIEANAKYRVADHSRIVLGVGYGYQDIDSGDLDLTTDGFLVRLGLELEF